MPAKNLTEGSVLKSLVVLSVPIIFANVLQTAYQLTDTFWVGRLGPEAIAAVSISFPVLFLMISLGGGLAMAGAILAAQYKGKNDQRAINHIAAQTLLMAIFVSVFLAVLGFFFSPALIRLMGTAPEVYQSAASYLRVSFIGIVFLFTYFVFQSLMRGVGNVKLPMFIVLGTVILNLALDPLLIFGYKIIPAMGVSGAAFASVATQGLSAFVGLLIFFGKKSDIHLRIRNLGPDFPLMRRMILLGFPTIMEQSSRALAMILMVFLVTSFGTVAIAAYGIGSRILSLVIISARGLSVATSTLVGQNIGAGKIDRAEKTVKISGLAGFFALTALGGVMFVLAEPLSSFFIPEAADTVYYSALFIKIMAFLFGFIGIRQVVGGAFKGAGDTLTSMMLSVVALWILRLPLAYVLSKHAGLQEVGIWIAFPAANVAAAIIALAWFSRGSWKNKRITEEIKVSEKITGKAMTEEGIR